MIKAVEIDSEEKLKFILDKGGILSNQISKDEGVHHWWVKEFHSKPPMAFQVIIIGNEGYAPVLCFAVEENKFSVYRLDESAYWFNKLGQIEEFSSYGQINEYIESLVNQDLEDFKAYMRQRNSYKWHK
jgi:hypothetical protein